MVVVKCAHTAEMFRVPVVAYKPCVDKIYSDTVKKHSIRVACILFFGQWFWLKLEEKKIAVSAEHLSC